MIRESLESIIQEVLLERTKLKETSVESLAGAITDAIFESGIIQDEDEYVAENELYEEEKDSYKEPYDEDDFEDF